MAEIKEIELPKPSVPELSVTLNRFLEGIKAIVSGDKYEEARTLVEEYQTSGEMQNLQQFLKEYAENHENYVTELWLNDMYLKNPLPLPINSSPFFLLPKQEFHSNEKRFRFIARFIIFSLMFKQRVDSGELKQEFSGGQKKGNALSMATYHHFFTAYRRPGATKDEHVFSEGGSRHIIVICNNQLFVLMIPGRIALPSEKALVEKLQKIDILSEQEPHYPPVGILTALNRKQWASIRERMIENKNNKESIQIIENCLFVVCMDESNENLWKPTRWDSISKERMGQMANHILHGNKSEHSTGNRWFDKFIQFIVTKNGVNGIVIERSVSEGITVLRFCEEFLDFVRKDQPKRSSDDLLRVKRLIWDLNKPLEKEIRNASAVTDALIDTLELTVFIFDYYGKNFPRKQKISPDVFIQLCLQLTYYRMHGKMTATYESAALRKFRFGRIDNIRASSQEALDFSKSMLDPSLSQAEKLDKFRRAVKKQTEMLLYTINGEGPDNHLLCLKEMAALHGLPEPALYQTDYYKEFLDFRLATSQVPTTYNITVGYGPVVPDGYGCSYNPQEYSIIFCISSFKNNPSTDSEKFAQNLQVSLLEVKELCKSGETAVSTSSPTKTAVKAETK
ncbi:choline O-acetyltransferase-like [Centruroides sculpturatus]|uniref:choline O-acetyltransferase-like n=1 Tax=Centruroides sculpturatus TaxID=218467 RepID=UPI000C6DB9DB|nr:choline O-acetyltransferase-like [Centruroides sculpturatus]